MSEVAKTLTFIAVAGVVILLAVVTTPRPPVVVEEDFVGRSLFESLDDPTKVHRIRIVTFDDLKGRAAEFDVAQKDGVWTLPSHQGYPADAKDQVISAATALTGLKVLGVKTDDPGEHEVLGVVEPNPAKVQGGVRGIGKLVILQDESGKDLARLIVGKKDKSASNEQPGMQGSELRFVRQPGQNRVYRAILNTEGFSDQFANWIETDLLKLNPWDIREVALHDYTVSNTIDPSSGTLRFSVDKQADIELGFNDQESKWTLDKLVEYKDQKPEEVKLAEGDELNTVRLNEMKNALDDLKIIDVARKPEQMSANLKADRELVSDESAYIDLVRRGFIPTLKGDDQVEIVSRDGEVVVRMKDGVEYVLRFGAVAGVDATPGKEDEQETDAADDAGTAEEAGGLKRYLLVMAQFNPDLIPKPDLEPLPEEAASDAETGEAENNLQEEAKEGVKNEAGENGAAPNDADNGDASKTAAPDDAESDSDTKANTEFESDADNKSDSENDEPAEDLAKLDEERERIEKENRRKQDEYDDKVKQGRERAKELNARFADWYYVINDDTYRKIHLTAADIIKQKESAQPEPETTGPSAKADPFQNLPVGDGVNSGDAKESK